MTQEKWTAVDKYFDKIFVPPDPALENAIAASTAAGLPAIAVSPTQGKLLFLLAQMQAARNILEIGTLGGYSTIWLARALPADGRLVTLETEPLHAKVARKNIARAGLEHRCECEPSCHQPKHLWDKLRRSIPGECSQFTRETMGRELNHTL